MSRIIDFCFGTPKRSLLTGFIATLLVASLFALPSYLYAHHTGGTITAVVESKERVCDGGQNGTCRWMVMTREMTFINGDSLWHWKLNSTDIQTRIRIGEAQTFTYYGWRIPFLSMYPNLISVE